MKNFLLPFFLFASGFGFSYIWRHDFAHNPGLKDLITTWSYQRDWTLDWTGTDLPADDRIEIDTRDISKAELQDFLISYLRLHHRHFEAIGKTVRIVATKPPVKNGK